MKISEIVAESMYRFGHVPKVGKNGSGYRCTAGPCKGRIHSSSDTQSPIGSVMAIKARHGSP